MSKRKRGMGGEAQCLVRLMGIEAVDPKSRSSQTHSGFRGADREGQMKKMPGAAVAALQPGRRAVVAMARSGVMPVDAASRTRLQLHDGDMAPCMSAAASGPSDEDLVERIRNGDRAAYDTAWDVLYDRWFPRMRSLCFLALGAEHADDVAQDILVKCARGIRRFRGRSSFSTWLHRIASNCIADKIRELVKARKREAVSDKDPEQLLDSKVERESGAREPVTGMEVRELVECCRDALDGLPRETLAIIALRREGKTFKQIGEELDLSENAVTGRFYRAAERVERSMQDPGRGGMER